MFLGEINLNGTAARSPYIEARLGDTKAFDTTVYECTSICLVPSCASFHQSNPSLTISTPEKGCCTATQDSGHRTVTVSSSSSGILTYVLAELCKVSYNIGILYHAFGDNHCILYDVNFRKIWLGIKSGNVPFRHLEAYAHIPETRTRDDLRYSVDCL